MSNRSYKMLVGRGRMCYFLAYDAKPVKRADFLTKSAL